MARPKRLLRYMLISCASFSNVPKHLAYNRSMLTHQSLLASICQRSTCLLLLLLLAGCSSATPTPAPVPTAALAGGSCTLPASNDDESALRGLLAAEGECVVAQNIDALMRLWAESARVMDAKNTPDNS